MTLHRLTAGDLLQPIHVSAPPASLFFELEVQVFLGAVLKSLAAALGAKIIGFSLISKFNGFRRGVHRHFAHRIDRRGSRLSRNLHIYTSLAEFCGFTFSNCKRYATMWGLTQPIHNSRQNICRCENNYQPRHGTLRKKYATLVIVKNRVCYG
jgi:hypothetical protein